MAQVTRVKSQKGAGVGKGDCPQSRGREVTEDGSPGLHALPGQPLPSETDPFLTAMI